MSAAGPVVETRKTTCNRDCPDACSIVATVEDGRIVRLAGDPDHPVTRGFLCWRTNHFLPVHHAAERLGAIRRESGPAAIFHYRSGGSLGMLKMLSDWFFELWGPVTVKRGD